MSNEVLDQPMLELDSMIGFAGTVPNGLKAHPNRQHIVYPIGCTVVLEEITTRKQEFLSGHTNLITCVAISKSGQYIASGQVTYMGYKAEIIVWDFPTRKQKFKFLLHKVKVEDLAFSANDKYLISLGGEDDGSVVVWNLEANTDRTDQAAICGSPAQPVSSGVTHCICCANNDDEVFVTGGNGTLRVWKLDRPNRKIRPVEVNMGTVKRVIKCIVMEHDDSFFYCGTTTGDIFAVNMASNHLQNMGPEKNKFCQGVTSITRLPTSDLLVGGGDGTICVVKGMEQKFKKTNKQHKLEGSGAITSLTLRGQGHQFFVGTANCQMYRVTFVDFHPELASTCHYAPVNDCAFPHGTGELFITCSFETIRVWAKQDCMERMRIVNPNKTCQAIDVSRDGVAIISGWDDGRIVGYTPETGSPMFSINDAHKGGVTALKIFSDCSHIISGGKEGGIRIWLYEKNYIIGRNEQRYIAKLLFALKEHKAMVTCIAIRSNNEECVSSSTDGSCIVWDLVNRCRKHMIHVNTLFQYICYHPAEYQLITTGSDKKISYYETYDASMIRELEGARTGSINSMDITNDGTYIVTAGEDKLVRVWLYDEGQTIAIGVGHSAPIQRAKFSPCERYILSVSSDGAILTWHTPWMRQMARKQNMQPPNADSPVDH